MKLLTPNVLLDQSITILAPTRVSDREGGSTTTWNEVAKLRGTTGGRPARASLSEDVRASLARDVELLEVYVHDGGNIVTGSCRIRTSNGREYTVVQLGHQESLCAILGARVA